MTDEPAQLRRYDRVLERWLKSGDCAVCKRCWIYVDTGACIYGGPYSGYEHVQGNLADLVDSDHAGDSGC